MKNNVLKYYTATFYLCSTFVAFAQPGTDDSGGSGNLEGTDPAAPIDGYVLVLAALGLVYVFLRIRAFAQQGNNPQD
jgi:hypothetical protein